MRQSRCTAYRPRLLRNGCVAARNGAALTQSARSGPVFQRRSVYGGDVGEDHTWAY
jgi:uncharacterized C2H2 Zn-finger protein